MQKKEIKDAYPKKVCHMLKRHVKKKKKKKRKDKDAYPKKVCHMPGRHVRKRRIEKKRKEKDSPHPQKIKKRERDDAKEFIHPSPKKQSHTFAHLDQIV